MGYISFQCYSCQQVLKVGDDKAGRKARCFKCGTILTVPVASTVTGGPPKSGVKVPPPLPPANPKQTPMPTVTAELIEPGKSPPRHEEPPLIGEVVGEVIDDDAYDDEEERRPRRRRRRREDDDEYDEEDERPRRAISQESRWRKVRVGLLLVFIGTCVYAGGYGIEQIGVLIQFFLSFSPPSSLEGMRSVADAYNAARVVFRIGEFILFGGVATSIVGYVFGLFAPNKFASLGLAIATVATAGVGALLMLPFRLFGRPSLGGSLFLNQTALAGLFFGPAEQLMLIHAAPASFIVGLLVDGCVLAAFILFPLFLRALARVRKDRDLAGDCQRLMVFASFAIGYSLLWPVLTVPLRATGAETARVATWVTWILYFINVGLMAGMLVWLLRTLTQARAVFEREPRSSRRD
jgi:hypothetical protein